jgi:prepilin-type N-terminal cleavage/methylation domain-containing protein/prepilin-type processing-associated H-X9-DG protein
MAQSSYVRCAFLGRDARNHRGLTLIEALVVIALLALVAALLLPAVQAARESSRRAQCLSNLHNIGLAMQAYVDAHRAFPPSTFESAVLPHLELSSVYGLVDYSVSPSDPKNSAARNLRVEIYHCPSDGVGWRTAGSNYGGNFGSGVQAYGYNGIIRPLKGYAGIGEDPLRIYVVSPAAVRDGLANTAAAAEILIATEAFDPQRAIWPMPTPLPLASQLDAFATACDATSGPLLYVPLRGVSWLFTDQSFTGYNHVLPPNRKSCTNGQSVPIGAYTANSSHPGGVNVLCADGHTSFVSETIDRPVWRAVGSRDNGEAISF